MQSLLEPIGASAWGGRYNFDGYLVKCATSKSYVQVFRSGSIEAADATLFDVPEQYKGFIPSIRLEEKMIEAVRRYLEVQNQLSTSLPIFTTVTLLRVRGFKMSSNPLTPFVGNEKIDREILPLPEIVVEDYSLDPGTLLQPAFDALWQACGIEKSMNYDDNGNWRPHSR